MPAQTPSPHRFLSRPSTSTQKPKPKPPSNLRHGFTAPPTHHTVTPRQAPIEPSETQRVTPARRFVIAPVARKSSSIHDGTSSQREEEDGVVGVVGMGGQQQTPMPKSSRRKFDRIERIQGGGHESHEGGEEDENADAELLFTPPKPKRRRLSSSPGPPQTSLAAPSTTTSASISTYRFIHPSHTTPKLPSTSTASTTSSSTPLPTRPHFLLPPSPTSKPATHPLPETFSPSRKGQKYVPGGLASTLQSWIVEVGSMAQMHGSGGVAWGRDREEGVRMRVRVLGVDGRASAKNGEKEGNEVECFAGGVVFVEGKVDMDRGMFDGSRGQGRGNGEVGVMLAGAGGARGSGGVKIREGSVVGIRAPTWDVEMMGDIWVVGVDWLVLS
ncbi:hypothetical protein P154DRAFT_423645 [Amniculicola lignicola CBS 123094]|uniref:Uncharacterized protein n=1 Tax=Amniculicola lignicola CBS 123094 TaxID=1392246 RepID=A0A6A5X2N4_9PLEO|nr:hypothetical protein P154DRAFT_423645 [Amniculicola lignicola CBS 123094]